MQKIHADVKIMLFVEFFSYIENISRKTRLILENQTIRYNITQIALFSVDSVVSSIKYSVSFQLICLFLYKLVTFLISEMLARKPGDSNLTKPDNSVVILLIDFDSYILNTCKILWNYSEYSVQSLVLQLFCFLPFLFCSKQRFDFVICNITKKKRNCFYKAHKICSRQFLNINSVAILIDFCFCGNKKGHSDLIFVKLCS